MSLTAANFPSNERIDKIKIGDNAVEIFGYIVNTGDNSHRGGSAKQFKKIVLSNGRDRLVQVTGWQHNSELLTKDAFEIGKMVYIGPVTACVIKNNYNLGNCNFELVLKENSVVEVHGSYTDPALQLKLVPIDSTIEEAYSRIGNLVSIEASIKTVPAKYKARDFEFYVGSVCNGRSQLEIKFTLPYDFTHVKKGMAVTIVGLVEKNPPGPVVVKIKKEKDFEIVDADNRMAFIDLIRSFKTH